MCFAVYEFYICFLKIPIGDFVNKSMHKRIFLMWCSLVSAIRVVLIIFTDNFWIFVFKSGLEGIATGAIDQTKNAIT